MTTQYTRLFRRSSVQHWFALAITLVCVIAFATSARATETGSATTGRVDDAATAGCAVAAPGLELSPGSQIEAGNILEYTVTVTNNDAKSCRASTFDLTVTYLPGGWDGGLSTTTLDLLPGATGMATLTVDPANNIDTDSARLQVAVFDAQEPVHARAAMVSHAASDRATGVADITASTMAAEPVEQAAQVEVAGPAFSSKPAARSSSAEVAAQLTRRMTGLLGAYNRASENARSNALAELVTVARQRHALLASLIEDDPGAVLRVAVPASFRQGMPVEVRPFLERRVDMEGELTTLYEDYPDGSTRLKHVLKVDGDHIAMHFKARTSGLPGGGQVSAQGVYLNHLDNNVEVDGAMALESTDSILTLAAGTAGDGGSNGGTTAPVPNTFGELRTLVLLVNFEDDPGNMPWTPGEARQLVFGTVSDFYRENSYGQAWLTGDVYGWYTLPVRTTDYCNQYSIATEAKSAAAAAGVDLSTYNHILYVFPGNSCTWSGLSTVGGSPSESWIHNDFLLKIVAHELGHGLGLFHSQSLDCSPGTLGSDCRSFAYGDWLDIMGSNAAHLNAFQKERLGWLNFGVSPPISVVETDGAYQVAPAETGGTEPRALKVLKSVDPATGNKTWYYLEYRQAIGFDSWIPEEYGLNGVVVHLGTENAGDSSLLLDMTPDSSAYGDLMDASLTVGQTYSDAQAGLTVTTEWTDGANAEVGVSFAQPGCVHADPTIVVSPSAGNWVTGGTPVTYSISVTNNDPVACSAAMFNLSASLPSGWVASFAASSLSLSPGESDTATLTVTSPISEADGFYDITVTVTNNDTPSAAASVTATYVVSAQTNNPPVAVSDSATTVKGQAVSIAVLANDSDPDGDLLSVQSADQGAKGTVTINADGTLTYMPDTKFKGKDSFSYTVTDGTDSAAAMVSVTSEGKGGSESKGGGKARR